MYILSTFPAWYFYLLPIVFDFYDSWIKKKKKSNLKTINQALDFGILFTLNQALLAKQAWRLLTNPN